jgi:hypothetical protein
MIQSVVTIADGAVNRIRDFCDAAPLIIGIGDRADESYRQTRASFALSDYELDDGDAERTGWVLVSLRTSR